MLPVAGSNASDALYRAGGLVVGEFWVQFEPSQVHVSERQQLPLLPPKRTVFPVTGSDAIEAPNRAGGLAGAGLLDHTGGGGPALAGSTITA
jgi:hypothetical protein